MHQNATHDTTSKQASYCQGRPKHIGKKTCFKEHVLGRSQKVGESHSGGIRDDAIAEKACLLLYVCSKAVPKGANC